HPEEIPNVLQQAVELYGLENVWKLLVLPVSGTEEHCGRHWDNISAVSFAAWSGDLYQYLYELVLMPQDANAELEQGKLYVAIDTLGISNENCLTYRVINPEGELVKNTIYKEQLGCTLGDPLNLDELHHHLPAIMAIIYERGEMNDVNPLQPEIADTHLLNLLYKYIPQEYRHIANAQLWDLQVKGEIMSAFRELIAEYNDYEEQFDNRERDENNAWQEECGGKKKLLSRNESRIWLNINYLVNAEGDAEWHCWVLKLRARINRLLMSRCVEEKCMQLGAFIAWQNLLEEKYRDEQKNSVKLVCR
ncbi:MAG TPA: hypothetical protein VL360_07650, partial [Gammaproteobacteria bacterium]|nr:hypothetical protein [Gammaproteobacteria bacterium]